LRFAGTARERVGPGMSTNGEVGVRPTSGRGAESRTHESWVMGMSHNVDGVASPNAIRTMAFHIPS
jgi:hypothetical protein